MRNLLKQRERENLKFLILMMLSIMLFLTCLLVPSLFNIFTLEESSDKIEAVIIMIFCFFIYTQN